MTPCACATCSRRLSSSSERRTQMLRVRRGCSANRITCSLASGYALVNVSGEDRLQKQSDGSAWFADSAGLGGWSVPFRVAVLDGSPAVVELHVHASDEQSIPRSGLSGTFLRQAAAPAALLCDPRVTAALASESDQVHEVASSSRSRSARQNDAMLARIALVNDTMAITGVDCTPVVGNEFPGVLG